MALGTLHSFDMHRGDARVITFVVKDAAGVVVDITAATLTWALAKQDPESLDPQPKGSASALVTKTIGSGITVTDPVNGAGEIALNSADTIGFKAPGDFYQELQIQLATKPTTIMFGIITLKKDLAAPGP